MRSEADPQLVADRASLRQMEEQQALQAKVIESEFAKSHAAASEAARNEELAKLYDEHSLLKMRASLLRDQRKASIGELTSHSEDHVDFELTMQELDQANKFLYNLQERHRLVSIESDRPAQVDEQQLAQAPSHPVERAPLKKMALAGIATFFIPFGLCVLWELQTQRLTDAKELEGRSIVPVIGELAALSHRGPGDSLRVYEDSVQNLRTYISLRWGDQPGQILAVCSAWTGEGKTTLAAQMATTMSQRGRTLLIDGDTRMPDIHAIFHADTERPGLVDVLAGRATARDSVQESFENLDVMPSGELDVSPYNLFSSEVFEELITWAREKLRLRGYRHAAYFGRCRGAGYGADRRPHIDVHHERRKSWRSCRRMSKAARIRWGNRFRGRLQWRFSSAI